MFVFLDASALIYLVEGAEPLASRVRRDLSDLDLNRPAVNVALSRLTWLECRVRPLREANTVVLEAYDAFFRRPDLTWVDLSAQVIELATEIRARTGLKTPEALQAASCLQLGGDHLFVTGDAAFRKVAGLKVRVSR
jgi:predicted nucleic acid-binding protein